MAALCPDSQHHSKPWLLRPKSAFCSSLQVESCNSHFDLSSPLFWYYQQLVSTAAGSKHSAETCPNSPDTSYRTLAFTKFKASVCVLHDNIPNVVSSKWGSVFSFIFLDHLIFHSFTIIISLKPQSNGWTSGTILLLQVRKWIADTIMWSHSGSKGEGQGWNFCFFCLKKALLGRIWQGLLEGSGQGRKHLCPHVTFILEGLPQSNNSSLCPHPLLTCRKNPLVHMCWYNKPYLLTYL